LEAHGTGTALGDPIEVGAAANALCVPRNGIASVVCPLTSRRCRVQCASLKANMGHLEACAASAGLASVIVTPLNAGFVAPNAQMRRLNAHLASLLSSSSAVGLFRMSVAVDECMFSTKLCAL